MDPISHTLLGASLGYAVFGKQLGRTAAVAGGLAALTPDADTFIRSATDPLLAVEYHRHFTHALTFAPVGAALVALLCGDAPGGRTRSTCGYAASSLISVIVCWTRQRVTVLSCGGPSPTTGQAGI